MYITNFKRGALYDIKGEELGHSHLIGQQACGMWAELDIIGWIQAQFFRKGHVIHLPFSFLLSNYSAFYYSESKPITYPNAVRYFGRRLLIRIK